MDSLPSFLGWTEFIRGLTLDRGWRSSFTAARAEICTAAHGAAGVQRAGRRVDQPMAKRSAREESSRAASSETTTDFLGTVARTGITRWRIRSAGRRGCRPTALVIKRDKRFLRREGGPLHDDGERFKTAGRLELVSSVTLKICFAEATLSLTGKKAGRHQTAARSGPRLRVPVVDTTDSWVEQAIVLIPGRALLLLCRNSGEAFLAPSAFGSRAKKKIGLRGIYSRTIGVEPIGAVRPAQRISTATRACSPTSSCCGRALWPIALGDLQCAGGCLGTERALDLGVDACSTPALANPREGVAVAVLLGLGRGRRAPRGRRLVRARPRRRRFSVGRASCGECSRRRGIAAVAA